MAAMIAITAITTSSSIKVKARRSGPERVRLMRRSPEVGEVSPLDVPIGKEILRAAAVARHGDLDVQFFLRQLVQIRNRIAHLGATQLPPVEVVVIGAFQHV